MKEKSLLTTSTPVALATMKKGQKGGWMASSGSSRGPFNSFDKFCPSCYKDRVFNFPRGGFPMAYKITDDCTMCDTCRSECPEEAISEADPKYVIDPAKCNDCGTCGEVCPVAACVPA
jgi:ferredoxin